MNNEDPLDDFKTLVVPLLDPVIRRRIERERWHVANKAKIEAILRKCDGEKPADPYARIDLGPFEI